MKRGVGEGRGGPLPLDQAGVDDRLIGAGVYGALPTIVLEGP